MTSLLCFIVSKISVLLIYRYNISRFHRLFKEFDCVCYWLPHFDLQYTISSNRMTFSTMNLKRRNIKVRFYILMTLFSIVNTLSRHEETTKKTSVKRK